MRQFQLRHCIVNVRDDVYVHVASPSQLLGSSVVKFINLCKFSANRCLQREICDCRDKVRFAGSRNVVAATVTSWRDRE